MGGFFTRQGIRQASILIAVVTVSSQLFGIVREAIIAGFFGTGKEYDIILLALAIPLMVGGLFFQAIPSAGIPFLQGFNGRKGTLRSPFIGINSILILLVSAIAFLVLPLFRGLLAEGLDSAGADRVILYGRIFCLIIPLRAYEAVFRALLHVRHHFLFPAIAILGFNICTIGLLLTLFPSLASTAYVIAWLVGIFVQTVLVMIPTVYIYRRAEKKNDDAFVFDRSGYLRYLGTIIMIESIGLLVDPFDRFLCGVYLDSGYVSAAHYANIINLVPVRVFMYSLATAVFPTFSERAADHNKAGLAVLYHKALAMGLMMLAPVTAFFLIFRHEIIGVLFERGAFVAQSRMMTSEILAYYAAGMFFIAVFFIQSRVYYALKSWKMLFIARPLTMSIKVVIGFWLIGDNWAMAVGGGTVAMFVVSFIVLETFLIMRTGLKYTGEDMKLLGKAIFGAAATVLLFWAVQRFGISVIGLDGLCVMVLSGVIGFGGLAVLDQVFCISGIRLFKAKRG